MNPKNIIPLFLGVQPKNTSIYKFGSSVWVSVRLFVCLFVSNKRQNDWTDRAKIFSGISRDPREGLWSVDDQIFKNLPPSKFVFWKFWKSTKFFFKSAKSFVFVICYKGEPLCILFRIKISSSSKMRKSKRV